MKKILCCLMAAGLVGIASDIQAQCRRGEIMTDAGCVQQGRSSEKQLTEDETKQAAKKALLEAFKSLEPYSSDLKSYLNDESKPAFQRLMAKINSANFKTGNYQKILSQFLPTREAVKSFVQESGDSHLTTLIANYGAVIPARIAEITRLLPAYILYTQSGPVIPKENPQEFVKVNYAYDKDGKLIGANGKGSFRIDDGFGNISAGEITQTYKVINGQAKLVKDNTDTRTKHLDGTQSQQEITVQYRYDNNGNLQSAGGSGKVASDDGFKNKTEGKITQTYLVSNEQAKLKESNQKFETKNVDGSSIDQDLTVTYAYDKNGKIRGASGSGTYEKNDGFGNITTGKIEQKYQMVAGNIQPAGGRGRRFIEDPQSINKLPGPPALPVITAVSKTTVEPEELVTIYGRNFSIKNEKGRRDHNLKQLLWMQGKWYRAVPVNFGKNRGEEESWEFIAPKNPGSYSFKIEAKGGDVLWDKPLIVVAKKGPPLPVLTGISKVEVEPKEAMVVYGKNLIAQDASGFTSMNFDKMFFVKDKAETRVTAITSGPKRGQDQSINFSAPKTAGSYSIKMIAKSGEVITWNNPMLAVIDRAAEELAKKKALEEEAKKKAEEELARKKALEEELTKKKAEEELALRKKQEEEEAPSSTGQYCNPDVPRYSQPGCIEPPEQEGPPPTQGQPCNPNIPRYQQPGCVE